MKPPLKYFIIGFLFGALGLYVLSALSLALPFFEVVAGPLFWPGRFLSETFVGSEGSDIVVLLLTLFNGVFYGLVFAIVGFLFTKK